MTRLTLLSVLLVALCHLAGPAASASAAPPAPKSCCPAGEKARITGKAFRSLAVWPGILEGLPHWLATEFQQLMDQPGQDAAGLLSALAFHAGTHLKAYEAHGYKRHLYRAGPYAELCVRLLEHACPDMAEPDSLIPFRMVFEYAASISYYLLQETDSLRYLERAYGFTERNRALLREAGGGRAQGHCGGHHLKGLSTQKVRERLLDPGQALIRYFMGDESLFIFVFTLHAREMVKVAVDDAFLHDVDGLRESLYQWAISPGEASARQYAGQAYRLYRKLILPVEHLLPERLAILPDGKLQFLPFDALLYKKAGPTYSHLPCLIERYQISYAHPALLPEKSKGRVQPAAARRQVLAFAPAFGGQRGSSGGPCRLANNVREVQQIARLVKTRAWKGMEATRERFLKEAPDYGVIHLATHAATNPEKGEYSFLAFTKEDGALQKELLYTKDLCSLRLKADLVVLSACETGIGELRPGGAVDGLAGGFLHAGARSLITTLWPVSDRETAELMRLFYEELKAGKAKDEALRAAKLRFISLHNSHSHPFFWAAFIPTGDMSPITLNSGIISCRVWLLLAALFVFLGWRFMKSKMAHAQN